MALRKIFIILFAIIVFKLIMLVLAQRILRSIFKMIRCNDVFFILLPSLIIALLVPRIAQDLTMFVFIALGNTHWLGMENTCFSNLFIHIPPIWLSLLAAFTNFMIWANFVVNYRLAALNSIPRIKRARIIFVSSFFVLSSAFTAGFAIYIRYGCRHHDFALTRLYAAVFCCLLALCYSIVGVLLYRTLSSALLHSFRKIKCAVFVTIVSQAATQLFLGLYHIAEYTDLR